MDFSLTQEQQMIVDSFSKYAQEEVKPFAERYRDQLMPKEEALRMQQNLLQFGIGIGFAGEEFGGLGLDAKTMGLLQFELA